MTSTEVTHWIRLYWGKARPRICEARSWHPLAWHSLDVAAAMMAILEVRPDLAVSVAKTARLSVEETRRRLILVAALHDLGKFAENFQQKAPEVFRELNPDAGSFVDRRGHGDIGAEIWLAWQDDGKPWALDQWLLAAFAHHGAPVRQAAEAYSDAASQTAVKDAVELSV